MTIHNDDLANINNWDACETTDDFNNSMAAKISQVTFDTRSCMQMLEATTTDLIVYNVAVGYENLYSGVIESTFYTRLASGSSYAAYFYWILMKYSGSIKYAYFYLNVKTGQLNISNNYGLVQANSGNHAWTDIGYNEWWKIRIEFAPSGSDIDINVKLYNPAATLKVDVDCDITNGVGVVGNRYGPGVDTQSDNTYGYIDNYNVDGDFIGGGSGGIIANKAIMWL